MRTRLVIQFRFNASRNSPCLQQSKQLNRTKCLQWLTSHVVIHNICSKHLEDTRLLLISVRQKKTFLSQSSSCLQGKHSINQSGGLESHLALAGPMSSSDHPLSAARSNVNGISRKAQCNYKFNELDKILPRNPIAGVFNYCPGTGNPQLI